MQDEYRPEVGLGTSSKGWHGTIGEAVESATFLDGAFESPVEAWVR